MKRKFISLLFTLVFVMGISSPLLQNSSAQISPQATAKVALVFSTGGLGDLSFNDAANDGLKRAIAKYGSDLTTATTEPADTLEIATAVEAFAADGSFDLIIAIGFSSFDAVNASAAAHPDENFVIIDSVVDSSNVASVVFAEQEGSFLAGAMAAMTSQKGSVAFLGGLDIPLINKFRAGFEHGAKYINPDIELSATYSPDPNNPWGDIAGGKSVGETFIENGADVIFAAAGGTGIGVFNAAKEAQDNGENVWGIGVDSNQDYLEKGAVLTSMIKRVDVAVEKQIDATIAETWTGGSVTTLGLEEDGVGITEMEFTIGIGNSVCDDASGDTRLDVVNSLKALIIAGTIEVASEVQTSYSTGGGQQCDTGIPNDELPNPDSDDDGLPLPFMPILFGFAIATLIVKKRK